MEHTEEDYKDLLETCEGYRREVNSLFNMNVNQRDQMELMKAINWIALALSFMIAMVLTACESVSFTQGFLIWFIGMFVYRGCMVVSWIRK